VSQYLQSEEIKGHLNIKPLSSMRWYGLQFSSK